MSSFMHLVKQSKGQSEVRMNPDLSKNLFNICSLHYDQYKELTLGVCPKICFLPKRWFLPKITEIKLTITFFKKVGICFGEIYGNQKVLQNLNFYFNLN